MAEDADVDIQPITRADFVPAKVFRSRSMNTLTAYRNHAAGQKNKLVHIRRRERIVVFEYGINYVLVLKA